MQRSSIQSLSRALAGLTLAVAFAASTSAGEVYGKPPSKAGGINGSAWVAPDGSDSDLYAWDEFVLPATTTITEVRWRGGYSLGAPFGGVTDFRVSFFDSVVGGFQPLIVALPEHEQQEITIATFHTLGNANETPSAILGGVQTYEYRFVLPVPVTLMGGVKYWFRVVGTQPVHPDWGLISGMGGDGGHFRYSTGMHMFQNVPHDLAFSLHDARPDVRFPWFDDGTPFAVVPPLPDIRDPWFDQDTPFASIPPVPDVRDPWLDQDTLVPQVPPTPDIRNPWFDDGAALDIHASFVASPTTGFAPLHVHFINNSRGSISSHRWSFGDGTTSTHENPVHLYTRPGIYTVTLTETGPGGTGMFERTGYIVVRNYVKQGKL